MEDNLEEVAHTNPMGEVNLIAHKIPEEDVGDRPERRGTNLPASEDAMGAEEGR